MFLLTSVTLKKTGESFDDMQKIIKKIFEPQQKKEEPLEKNPNPSPKIKKEDSVSDHKYTFKDIDKGISEVKNTPPIFFTGEDPYLLISKSWHFDTNIPHKINEIIYTAWFVDASLAKDRKSLLHLSFSVRSYF